MLIYYRKIIMISISLLLTNVSTFCMLSEKDRAAIQKRQDPTRLEQTIDQRKSFGRSTLFFTAGTLIGAAIVEQHSIKNFILNNMNEYFLLAPVISSALLLGGTSEYYFGKEDENSKTRLLGLPIGFLLGCALADQISK